MKTMETALKRQRMLLRRNPRVEKLLKKTMYQQVKKELKKKQIPMKESWRRVKCPRRTSKIILEKKERMVTVGKKKKQVKRNCQSSFPAHHLLLQVQMLNFPQ